MRQRQRNKKLVPLEIINKVSDDVIIDSYITCCECGEKGVTVEELNRAIIEAEDVDDFFRLCDCFSGTGFVHRKHK